MLKRYICLLSVVMLSLVASNYSHALEINEIYKLTPEDAEIQSNLNNNYFNNTEKNAGIKGDFELEGAWLEPKDTIFASNGYILYWINIHDAKFYDKFIWAYFIPILSTQTGIPTGEYATIYSGGSYLIYMPPDSSKTDIRYWEPYWSYWWSSYQRTDFFNPDSCWAFGVGYSFLDFYAYMRDPGVWKTEVNMATETDITPSLLCDTLFYVIDDIPPAAYIINIQDSSYVGDSFTIQATGWDNAFVEKTELYIDGVLVQTVAGSPLEYLWTVPQDEEIHILQSKAYDVYNPPLQLGLCGSSKSYRVSRTNVQATQIVASDNVKLFYAQTDTVLQGHFSSLYSFVEDTKYPVGVLIDADKKMYVKFNLDLECFNFGQPSTWKPVCKFKVELSGLGKALADSTFTGWNGNVIIDKEFNHIKDENIGNQTLVFSLTFEDINGNLISEQQINLPCLVFFDKPSNWHKERILVGWGEPLSSSYASYSRQIVPNWFYYWSDLECFVNSAETQSDNAIFARDMYSPLGTPASAYAPFFNDTKYFISPYACISMPIPNEYGTIVRTDYGIHLFGFSCRHENLHRTYFLQWWDSWLNYERVSLGKVAGTPADQDLDDDLIPNDIEATYGLSPYTFATHDDSIWPLNQWEYDKEYIIYKEHEGWAPDFMIWDFQDFANPGKLTFPKY